jgi:hypothetical protein
MWLALLRERRTPFSPDWSQAVDVFRLKLDFLELEMYKRI